MGGQDYEDRKFSFDRTISKRSLESEHSAPGLGSARSACCVTRERALVQNETIVTQWKEIGKQCTYKRKTPGVKTRVKEPTFLILVKWVLVF